ncbi:unnamed protein product, partial [Symbiodinium sp. CCMP2456]
IVLLIFVGVRTPLNMTAIMESMPRLTQKGPSCGSTCLAMSLEFLGLPCDPDIIERRIHPYGAVDLGELPAELAKFARHVGFVAQHYNFGTLEQLKQYREMGCAVIVMLNYNGGTGHLVNLLGFDADDEGVVGVRIRNPWGFDETIPVERFLNEWRHLRQSRSSMVGYMLPVFDAGYAVVSSSGGLPATPIVDWLHSAPVDVLIASLTFGWVCGLHRLSQFFGNLLGVLGGAGAYAVGNLIGLNIAFVGDDCLLLQKSSLISRMLVAVGWSFSVAGGLLAAAVWLLRQPMVLLGERFAGRDALCEAVFDASSPRLRSALVRAGADQLARQVHLLRGGHGDAEWHACASWSEINRGRIGQEVEGWPCSAAAKRQSGHPKVPNQELRKVLSKNGIGSSSPCLISTEVLLVPDARTRQREISSGDWQGSMITLVMSAVWLQVWDFVLWVPSGSGDFPGVSQSINDTFYGNWNIHIWADLNRWDGRHFTYCLGDYLGCVKDEIATELIGTFTWETGIGLHAVFAPSMAFHGDKVGTVMFSHSAYKSWAHDAAAGRPADMMVASNKTSLPPGVLPDLSPDILLNFDTGSAEHTARRKLLADALPSLGQEFQLDFQVPPGTSVDGISKRAVFDTVGFNLFRALFGVDVGAELGIIFEYDGTFTPAVLGAPVLAFQGRRLSEIRSTVMKKVEAGEIARNFIALATERGMSGKQRLDEMVWIALFAGYGGTGNLAYETLRLILKDPGLYVPMFQRDADAFMLEAARIKPPVGGMNPAQFRKSTQIHFNSIGKTWTAHEGELTMMLSSGANHDPSVFKDAHKFIPGRENAERLLSWNNEWGAFKTCDTVAGCPAAPRGCPGTFLSMKLARDTVAAFVKTLATKPIPAARGLLRAALVREDAMFADEVLGVLGRLEHHRGLTLSQVELDSFAKPLLQRALRWCCPSDDEAAEELASQRRSSAGCGTSPERSPLSLLATELIPKWLEEAKPTRPRADRLKQAAECWSSVDQGPSVDVEGTVLLLSVCLEISDRQCLRRSLELLQDAGVDLRLALQPAFLRRLEELGLFQQSLPNRMADLVQEAAGLATHGEALAWGRGVNTRSHAPSEIDGRRAATLIKWVVSAWQNLGGRRTQEDRLAICPLLGSDDSAFFGIWDGTVDDFAADQVQRLVLPNILQTAGWASYQELHRETTSTDTALSAKMEFLQASLKEAVLSADEDVVQKCRDAQNHYSSCTGVMVLVAGGVLTVAHLGDSHAVLGCMEDGDWHADALTVAHKPNTPSERQRIEDSGGVVQCIDDRRGMLMRAFLCGGDFDERKARGDNPRQLAYSRAFGGKDLKPYGLSNEPDIRQVVLNEQHKVLIMASDGLWDVCSEEKAVYLAMDAAERDLDAAQVLVEFALTENRINRTKADNITVIAVFFK